MRGVVAESDGGSGFIILGDDGTRYSFASHEWRGVLASPRAGVRVDFEVRGFDAVNIYGDDGAAPAPSTRFRQRRPQRQRTRVSRPWDKWAPSPGSWQEWGAAQRQWEAAQRPIVKKDKAVVGLLCIFLGPIGAAIAVFYVEAQAWRQVVSVCAALLLVIVFPLGLILWLIVYVPIGIYCLLRDDDKFDFDLHRGRDHRGFNSENCLTGECDNTLEGWKRRVRLHGTSPPRRPDKACPYCAESIEYEAVRCPYCDSEVANATPS